MTLGHSGFSGLKRSLPAIHGIKCVMDFLERLIYFIYTKSCWRCNDSKICRVSWELPLTINLTKRPRFTWNFIENHEYLSVVSFLFLRDDYNHLKPSVDGTAYDECCLLRLLLTSKVKFRKHFDASFNFGLLLMPGSMLTSLKLRRFGERWLQHTLGCNETEEASSSYADLILPRATAFASG